MCKLTRVHLLVVQVAARRFKSTGFGVRPNSWTLFALFALQQIHALAFLR
jgi:hypothetical protein